MVFWKQEEGQFSKRKLRQHQQHIIEVLSKESVAEYWISQHFDIDQEDVVEEDLFFDDFFEELENNSMEPTYQKVIKFQRGDDLVVQFNCYRNGETRITFFLQGRYAFRFMVNEELEFSRYKNDYYDVDSFFGNELKGLFTTLFFDFYELVFVPFSKELPIIEPLVFFGANEKAKRILLTFREIHRGNYHLETDQGMFFDTDIYTFEDKGRINIKHSPRPVFSKARCIVVQYGGNAEIIIRFTKEDEVEQINDKSGILSEDTIGYFENSLAVFIKEQYVPSFTKKEKHKQTYVSSLKERSKKGANPASKRPINLAVTKQETNEKTVQASELFTAMQLNEEVHRVEELIEKLDKVKGRLDVVSLHEYERLREKLFPSLTASYVTLEQTTKEEKRESFLKSLEKLESNLLHLYEKIEKKKEYEFDKLVELISITD